MTQNNESKKEIFDDSELMNYLQYVQLRL